MNALRPRALNAAEYDLGWRDWSDFIRYNPGARHRRNLISCLSKFETSKAPFNGQLVSSTLGCVEASRLILN